MSNSEVSDVVILLQKKQEKNERRNRKKKSLLNNMWFVLVAFVVSVFLGAQLFYWTQHPTTDVSYLDSLYWAFQVATTTGPGDVTPKTDAGKILFIIYNLVVSVGLLLLLGANIVMRAIENADILTHDEQEWDFSVTEQIYAMTAWNTQVLFMLAQQQGFTLPPLLPGQNPVTGEMPPCPPQPHDTGEDEVASTVTG